MLNIFKNYPIFFLLKLFISNSLLVYPPESIISTNDGKNQTKIIFGSCADYVKKEIDIFNTISQNNPDLFLWVGDSAYIDTSKYVFITEFPSSNSEIIKKFNKTKYNPSYEILRKKTPILGIWDDHDYGENNGDKYNKNKEIMRELYLDFLDEPLNSKRRFNKGGIYTSYFFSDQRIQLILLDTRYNKDNYWENGDMLGKEQWNWLENELKNYEPEIIFLVSGTQFLPNDRIVSEAWYNFSREKLFQLIEKYNKTNIILISGDIHIGEIMQLQENCVCEKLKFRILEITSSGLTHYIGDKHLFRKEIVNFIFTDSFSKEEDRFFGYNFGNIEIFWNFNDGNDTLIKLQIKNIKNDIMLEKNIFLNQYKNTSNCAKKINGNLCVYDKPMILRYLENIFWKLYYYLIYICFLFVFVLVLVLVYIVKKRIIKKNE